MKTAFLSCCLATICFVNCLAQNSENEHYIEVIGSAEILVEPDEIYIKIVVKEYKKDREIVSIETIEKEVVEAIEKLGYSSSDLEIQSTYGRQFKPRKTTSDIRVSRVYLLKINSIKSLNELFEALEETRAQQIEVAKTDHSEIEEIRKRVKIQATKNAKEKAKLLLEAIDSEIGEPLLIKELHPSNITSRNRYDLASNSLDFYQARVVESKVDLDIQKIRLRYEVLARFKISGN